MNALNSPSTEPQAGVGDQPRRGTLRGLVVFVLKLLAAGLILYFVRDSIDLSQIRWALVNPRIAWLMPAAWVVNQLMIALRLNLLLRAIGIRVPYGVTLRTNVAAMLVASVVPGIVGTDVVKVLLLRNVTGGAGIARLATVTILDRAIGLGSLILLSGGASVFLEPAAGPLALSLVRLMQILSMLGIGAFVIVCLSYRSLRTVVEGLTSRPGLAGRLGSILDIWLFPPLLYLPVLAASVVGVGAVVWAQARISLELSPSLLPASLFFLFPASVIISTLPVTPLGLGVGQLAMGELFQVWNMPAEIATTTVSLTQITLCLMAVAFGGPQLWMLSSKRHRTKMAAPALRA